ncbi:MAG: YcxB family protein [Herpetosiphonaceae bacterium]|nr:YcxB family protein [Herpetosiphonaceae bacterium]
MDTPTMTVDVTPTVADYQYLQYWTFFSTLTGKAFVGIAGFNLVVALYAAVAFPEVLSLGIFFLPLVLVVMLVFMYIGPKRTFGAMAPMREARTYQLSEQGLHVQGSTFSSQTTWALLRNVVETKQAFFFFIAPQQAYIIPKRSLVNPTALAELRKLIAIYASAAQRRG